MSLAEFRGAFTHIFSEFLVEVIHVLVTHLVCYLVLLQPVLQQKLFRELDPLVVNVGIEIFAHGFAEDLAEISAVISEKRRYGIQLDIVLEVMVDIEKHIIQNRITGRAADRVHDHFGLFRQKPDDLAEVIGFVDILDDRGIPHKRYFCRSVVAVHGFADLQVEICQEQLDFRYLTGNMRKSMFQFGQCLYRHPAVTGLDISHKAPGIIGKGSLCERHGSVMPYRAGVGIGAGSGLIGRICIAGTGGIRQHFISDGVLLRSTEKTAFKLRAAGRFLVFAVLQAISAGDFGGNRIDCRIRYGVVEGTDRKSVLHDGLILQQAAHIHDQTRRHKFLQIMVTAVADNQIAQFPGSGACLVHGIPSAGHI